MILWFSCLNCIFGSFLSKMMTTITECHLGRYATWSFHISHWLWISSTEDQQSWNLTKTRYNCKCGAWSLQSRLALAVLYMLTRCKRGDCGLLHVFKGFYQRCLNRPNWLSSYWLLCLGAGLFFTTQYFAWVLLFWEKTANKQHCGKH